MFKKRFCDKSAQTDVLKNILPLNSILSKFSELNLHSVMIKISPVTHNEQKSPKFTKDCQRLPKIAKDGQRSPKIAEDSQRSFKYRQRLKQMTKDLQRSTKIKKNH